MKYSYEKHEQINKELYRNHINDYIFKNIMKKSNLNFKFFNHNLKIYPKVIYNKRFVQF